MGSPLTAAKRRLRSLMKQRLSAVPQASVAAQSGRIFESLKDFEPYKQASRISIFLSMPAAEVQTDAIVRHALGCGKHVFVPYLYKAPVETANTPARVMDMVQLASVDDYESLTLDRWGIPSVDPASVGRRRHVLGGLDAHASDLSTTLHLMLVPGVAFDLDATGSVRRLGHGKGFYDFFLNSYLARVDGGGGDGGDGRPPLLLYGLALTEQFLSPSSGEQVPVGSHDRKLHGLILGDGQTIAPSSSHGLLY